MIWFKAFNSLKERYIASETRHAQEKVATEARHAKEMAAIKAHHAQEMAAKEAHHAQEMAAVRTEYGLDVVTPPPPLPSCFTWKDRINYIAIFVQ